MLNSDAFSNARNSANKQTQTENLEGDMKGIKSQREGEQRGR